MQVRAARARLTAKAEAIALFQVAIVKADKITDAAGMMIEAAAIALSREDVVRDTDVDQIMIEAGKATDPGRITVGVTPVVRIITGRDGATDMVTAVMAEVDRNLARVARPRDRVKVKTSSTPAVTTAVTIWDTAGKWTSSVRSRLC
jgi:hypothetical protein